MVEPNAMTPPPPLPSPPPPPTQQQPTHDPLASHNTTHNTITQQQVSPPTHPSPPPPAITQHPSQPPPPTTIQQYPSPPPNPITWQRPSSSPRPPQQPPPLTQEHPNHNLAVSDTISTNNNTATVTTTTINNQATSDTTTTTNHNPAASATTNTTQQHPPPPPPNNMPCLDLLDDERRADFIDICVPLYEASIKGEWEAAKDIIDRNPTYNLVRCGITENCETALHVAVSGQSNTQSTKFVQHLVNLMQPQDLQLQNKNGNTALCLAAGAGNVNMAKIMVAKNENLLSIPNTNQMMPLYIAAVFVKHEMMDYLYDCSRQLSGPGWTSRNKGWLLLKCIEVDRFDMALKILENHNELLADQSESMLAVLARKPSAFNEPEPIIIWSIIKTITCSKVGPAAKESEATQLLRKIWTETVKRPRAEINRILRGPEVLIGERSTRPSRILFVATEMGNTKFIVELIRKYPDLIWKLNDDGQSIFHIAVSHRHESIYSLLYEIGLMKDLITPLKDSKDNNMLHMVGKTAETSRLQEVSGVAFQMQRELLWFKEVQSMIPPHHRERMNQDGQKPYDLFTESHKDLVSNGEKWMKGTASKCMVVATLIATIVFTVAFTIPGGYRQDKGFPVFLHNGPFIAFVVFDAISLFLSSTSILVFLSILTSRYAQLDFLESLPKKLMVGLATLFLSIVTMMIAFAVSFFVLYRSKFIGVAIIISILALIPIATYAKLQYPLLMDVFLSTRRSRHLFRPKKQMLYYKNPRV